MDKNVPSDTYKKLYAKILGPLFKQLCEANPIYAVKVRINNMPTPLAIWSEYNSYFEKKVSQECFQYDLWAYAKIFYHLELYNIPILQQVGTDFLRSSANTFVAE